MEPLYVKKYHIPASDVDCHDRLKLSALLSYAQEVAGDHSALLGASRNALMKNGIFWAIIRNRVQITRLPRSGENIRVETWPMPTTRTAYPRSTIAYDEAGQELFRCISLWVLMDAGSRSMVLPGKSGVEVAGQLRGCELALPGSLAPREYEKQTARRVCYSDLDVNFHMNNCRYLDWIADLLPAAFHSAHTPAEVTLCYLSEAREGEVLKLSWELSDTGALVVETSRESKDESPHHNRVFAAKIQY